VVRSGRNIVALLAVVALSATACGGDDEVTEPAPTSPTPSLTTPSVEVPEDVTLTEPGTRLSLGDPASAVYADNARASVLTVTVSKVVKGSIKDFKRFVLSAKERASTPYYVSATVTNEGPRQLGQTTVPLYGVDSTDTALTPTSLVGDFDPCPGAPFPTGFAPGDSVTTCLVYLIPPRARLTAVQLRTSDQTDPITWSVV
jgi:hypothetical protein